MDARALSVLEVQVLGTQAARTKERNKPNFKKRKGLIGLGSLRKCSQRSHRCEALAGASPAFSTQASLSLLAPSADCTQLQGCSWEVLAEASL